MKRTKCAVQWIASAMLAFVLVNLLCFFYERPTAWFDTPNGPSLAGWRPRSILVHGTEGYGITKIDENGYINPSGRLGDSYILMMGSSHTQGKEVPSNKKYSVLVNQHFARETDNLFTYNIASDGNFLPTLFKHFHAAVQAFPDSKMISIEVSNTDFSVEEMQDALLQVEYDEGNSVANQYRNSGIKTKITNTVKESFPLLSLIKTKLKTAGAQSVSAKTYSVDEDVYFKLLNQAMEQIRSEYEGPIVFVYHPPVALRYDGTLELCYGTMWPEFQQACANNQIDVIDMGPYFEQWFRENKQLPYGFLNTAFGTGHLNEIGHQLIANALIAYIGGRT